jgi:hypothetical protein
MSGEAGLHANCALDTSATLSSRNGGRGLKHGRACKRRSRIGHLTHYHTVASSSLQVLPHVIRDLLTGCKPNTWFRFHVSNQLVEIHDS